MKLYATVFSALLVGAAAGTSACSSEDVIDNKQNKILDSLDIEVDGSDTFVKKGSTRQMRVIADYTDDTKLDVSKDPGTVWSTSNAAEATVDKNGLVTTLTEGTVTIKATYNGRSADESIKITP